MADDRSGSGAAADEVHDDDELAEVLAAELERYSTGVVPVIGRPTGPPPAPLLQPRGVQRIDPAPPAEPPSFARRVAEVDAAEAFRRGAPTAPTAVPPGGAPTGRRAQRLQDLPATTDEVPVRRRSGFRPPPEALPPADPIDRILPTGPVSLPESTASLIGDMISTPADDRPARHAAQPAVETPGLHDPSSTTGPLSMPRGLYSDWEQSLRSIGRPRSPWEDGALIPGGAVDAPTVAMAVQRQAAPLPPGPLPDDPREPAGRSGEAPAHSGAHALPVPEDEPADAGRRRRPGRRRAATPEPEDIAAEPVADDPTIDAEGIDEVVAPHPHVSAAVTGAIELPSVEPKPRTAPVLIERMRTALLTVPAAATGSGAAAIVGRWFGAFASPLALLLAVGAASAGAGAASGAAVLAGVLLALPAVGRSAVWAARTTDDAVAQEGAVLGSVAGRVAAAVLLLARLVAGVAVVFAIAATVSAWAVRTGSLGGSASTSAIGTAVGVGVLATGIAALPRRATAVAVGVLGGLGMVATVLLALVLAPGDGGPVRAPGVVAAVVGGFAGVGLLLVLCGPDVARWRTALPRPASSGWAAVIAAVGGGLIVAALLLVAPAGSGGAPEVLADALTDATAAALAAPVGVLLLLASMALPVLLLSSAGAAAARLVDRGRSTSLGTVAAGLLVLAGALGLLAAAPDPDGVLIAAAGLAGVPVAAWAGLVTLAPAGGARRPGPAAIVLLVGVVVGWACCDGLLPGVASPVLGALGLSALRGGPAAGLLVALLLGLLGGVIARSGRPVSSPTSADTVEG